MSKANSEVLSLNSPILSIDFRSGSVEMRLGLDVWLGLLPMSAADRSQINTARGTCQLEKIGFAPLLAVEG